MFLLSNFAILIFSILSTFLLLRFLSKTCLITSVTKLYRCLIDKCYVHQYYNVPKYNENMQENQLYRKVYSYLNSLPSIEDSDFANLFSGSKCTEINLILNDDQTITDTFLGARVFWNIEKCHTNSKSFVLKIRKNDKRRILAPYLQYIHQVFDEIEQKKKEVRLYVNVDKEPDRNERWRSTPFTHPANMDTIFLDADVKTKIKADLDTFLKSRQYYHRLGRVWRRSYLLFGPSGTGKSTFVAAMAKYLSYDVYEINLHKVLNDSDLKYLLLQTTKRSLLVIEDSERYLSGTSTNVSLSGILNFMDGILSSCGDERVMVFTMSSKEHVDPNVLRPGRIDVHINFPLCDFVGFKSLANSHLGLKDHKLFPQVEEIFHTGASLSPAEVCEIMISNRSSPSRALKTVITALQSDLAARVNRRLNKSVSSGFRSDSGGNANWVSRMNGSRSGRLTYESDKEGQNGIHPIKEIKNLYGYLKSKSTRKPSTEKLDVGVHEGDSYLVQDI